MIHTQSRGRPSPKPIGVLCAVVALLAAAPAHAGEFEAEVAHVISGSEIELADGRRVRYIGVHTPDLRHQFSSVRHRAERARAENASMVLGKRVRVEMDIDQRDSSGRVLGYVFVDGRFVNGEMVRRGWAMASKPDLNRRYAKDLSRYEREAKAFGRGIWGGAVEFAIQEKLDKQRGTHPSQNPKLNGLRPQEPKDPVPDRLRIPAPDAD